MHSDAAPPRLLGLFVLGMGGFVMGIGFGVVPVDPSTVHAPPWVLALCGLVFVFGGVAVLAHGRPRVQSAAGGVIVLAMGLVGAWVALYGDAAQFSGGLPFLPEDIDIVLARVTFGAGSAMCLALFAWGTIQLLSGKG